MLKTVYRCSLYIPACVLTWDSGKKYHVFTAVLIRQKFWFFACSRTTVIKLEVKELKNESHTFLVSDHEAITLNVFQHCRRMCWILLDNEANLNMFYTVPGPEYLKPFKLVALWRDTKNAWPVILSSFALVIVVWEHAENDNFFRVRNAVKTWYFLPESQHPSTYASIYKLIYYSSQEVATVHSI